MALRPEQHDGGDRVRDRALVPFSRRHIHIQAEWFNYVSLGGQLLEFGIQKKKKKLASSQRPRPRNFHDPQPRVDEPSSYPCTPTSAAIYPQEANAFVALLSSHVDHTLVNQIHNLPHRGCRAFYGRHVATPIGMDHLQVKVR